MDVVWIRMRNDGDKTFNGCRFFKDSKINKLPT